MLNLLILNPKERQNEAALLELKKHPDAFQNYEQIINSKHEVTPGEVLLVADRTSKKLIAISFSLNEAGIDPFALKRSLGTIQKVFLTNSLPKKINMNWRLNNLTRKEIEQLDIGTELLETMEG